MRTFDEAFSEHRLTYREREMLVHHLASMRYRKLLETLLPTPLRGGEAEGREKTE